MMGGRPVLKSAKFKGSFNIKPALTGGTGHRFRVYYDGSVARLPSYEKIPGFYIEDYSVLFLIMKTGGKCVDSLVQRQMYAAEERDAREEEQEHKKDASVGQVCFHFKPYNS